MYSRDISREFSKEDNFQFESYYVVNNNWMNDEAIDVMQVLRDTYGDFYVDNQPNYKKLKEQLILNNYKAKELFKGLFRISHVLGSKNISINASNILNDISTQYGNKIYAHGVEESKGGMYNLLMMAVSNCIRVPSLYWGYFKEGPPNISPLSHGPYYVIYTTNAKNMRQPNMPTLAEVEYILVPFAKNKQILEEYATTLVKFEVLDKDLCELFCSKLINYENFLLTLNQDLNRENELNFYPVQSLFVPSNGNKEKRSPSSTGIKPLHFRSQRVEEERSDFKRSACPTQKPNSYSPFTENFKASEGGVEKEVSPKGSPLKSLLFFYNAASVEPHTSSVEPHRKTARKLNFGTMGAIEPQTHSNIKLDVN